MRACKVHKDTVSDREGGPEKKQVAEPIAWVKTKIKKKKKIIYIKYITLFDKFMW